LLEIQFFSVSPSFPAMVKQGHRKKETPPVEVGVNFFIVISWRQPESFRPDSPDSYRDRTLETYLPVRIQGLSPGRLTGTVGSGW